MANICNQVFVKDSHRNRKHAATVRCMCCMEESNFSEPFPFLLTTYTKWMENFAKIHKDKGCNKREIDPPDWAAKEVKFGVVA